MGITASIHLVRRRAILTGLVLLLAVPAHARPYEEPEKEKSATVTVGRPRQVWALGESTNQPHAEIDNPDIVQIWFANDNNQVWVKGLKPGKATIKINYDLYNLNIGKHETHTGWLHIVVVDKESAVKQSGLVVLLRFGLA
jgi:hypothetical protein